MYQKLERLGQGAYGVVYRAQNKQTKEIVAMKVIQLGARDYGIPPSAIREIALLKEASHENILKLYDVAHTQYNLTIVFEYCDCDLKKYMNAHPSGLDTNQVLKFSKMLLKSLAYIHSRSIIHRDIKPQNLLVNRDGILKLGDFGLACSTFNSEEKLSPEVITQWYRPPEILLCIQQYGTEIDIWSAGCVIFEIATGHPLFQCQSNYEQLGKICKVFGTEEMAKVFPQYHPPQEVLDTPRTPLNELMNGISEDVINLVSQMLQIDPSKRISAADALKLELLSFV